MNNIVHYDILHIFVKLLVEFVHWLIHQLFKSLNHTKEDIFLLKLFLLHFLSQLDVTAYLHVNLLKTLVLEFDNNIKGMKHVLD